MGTNQRERHTRHPDRKSLTRASLALPGSTGTFQLLGCSASTGTIIVLAPVAVSVGCDGCDATVCFLRRGLCGDGDGDANHADLTEGRDMS